MEAAKIHNIAKKIINMDEIIRLTLELISLFKQENDHLERFEVGKITDLQLRKHEVAERLEFFRIAITQNPQLKDDIDKASLEILYNINSELNDVIVRNQYLLDRAIAANSKVMELIREAVVDLAKERAGYNSQGNYGKIAGKDNDSTPPISISEKI